MNCDSVTIPELRSVTESFKFNSTVKGKFLMLFHLADVFNLSLAAKISVYS